MAELLTVCAPGELIEAEVSLQLKGSGKSGQAGRTGELLGFWAGNSVDDGGEPLRGEKPLLIYLSTPLAY